MSDWQREALDRLLSMTTFFENEDDRLTINVSGNHYEINGSDLFKFPTTLLGDPYERARYLAPISNEYFFARHGTCFESILLYYINDGVLIKPETVPPVIFYEEIRFFKLNEKLAQRFYNDHLLIEKNCRVEENDRCQKSFRRVFLFPPTNVFTFFFNFCSMLCNALSIYSLCLETISVYRHDFPSLWIVAKPPKKFNETEDFPCSDFHLRPYRYLPNFTSENGYLELVCVTWFYVELFVRTFSSTSFASLLFDPNFFLDLVSILPTLISRLDFGQNTSEEPRKDVLSTSQLRFYDRLTCLKLFRLFRVARHGTSLEILIKVIYIHLKEVLMLSVLIAFGSFYFGLTHFVLEQLNTDSEINNIGEAIWHGFTAIVTVGYSDITEYRFLSYLMSIVAVWYGSISMAVVLPGLTQTYHLFHNIRYRTKSMK